MIKELQGLDAYMDKLVEDWNAPAVGVGIVKDDELVFAKGYGYRDYGNKLPFTPRTLFQIGSNTKLFTAVAAGMMVEEGKLTWDKPVRDTEPAIRFYNDQLNNNVTLRDMLAHRTGITRHDTIWYKSGFTRKELFDRVRLMEPKEPMRQICLYNNMMYAAVGYLIQLCAGKTWEEFVREKILDPLDMVNTTYSVPEMVQAENYAVPFTEKRDCKELYRIPHYEDQAGIAPAGAIISSIEDMSHWLITLMNNGMYRGRQILPPSVLKATLESSIALPNTNGEARGFWELLNCAYGMGRMSGSYRGRLLTFHGGAIGGCYSQVSYLPQEKTGVVVFVIGNHCSVLPNIVGYNVYERLLGLDETPWSERWLAIVQKGKEADIQARAKAGGDRVLGTRPSHALSEYAAEYEHPAYGLLKITTLGDGLHFDFHKTRLPLNHYHYDRFDTPDDEQDGKWSVNFLTNPQGEVDKAVISLDEADVTFTRMPQTISNELKSQIAGFYESPDGFTFEIVLREDGSLYHVANGMPDENLVPYKDFKFRLPRCSDVLYEFVFEGEQVSGFKVIVPSGEFMCPRKKFSPDALE
jgi:CubicO group peptidase (beta-lactamase class C family)